MRSEWTIIFLEPPNKMVFMKHVKLTYKEAFEKIYSLYLIEGWAVGFGHIDRSGNVERIEFIEPLSKEHGGQYGGSLKRKDIDESQPHE